MRKSFLSSMVLVASLYGVPSCVDDGQGQPADNADRLTMGDDSVAPAGTVGNNDSSSNEATLTGDTDAVALGAERDQARTPELGSLVADISESASDPIAVAPDGISIDSYGRDHGCHGRDCDDDHHGHGCHGRDCDDDHHGHGCHGHDCDDDDHHGHHGRY